MIICRKGKKNKNKNKKNQIIEIVICDYID